MTVFLHIGMSKSGSSAIQRMLLETEEALRTLGFCYPSAGRHKGAHYPILRQLENGEPLSKLAEAMSEGGSDQKIIISAEGFWLVPTSQVRQLRDAFGDRQVNVVLYLRRPESYLPASFHQKVRMGRSSDEDAFLERVGPHLDYPALLTRWANAFPLRVRAYESVRRSLESDFLSAVGAEGLARNTRRRVVNATLGDGTTRVMSIANRVLPKLLSRRLRPWIMKCDRLFSRVPMTNDERLREYGLQARQAWDVGVLERHLSPEDLDTILQTEENAS